jgi:hypothetical protein
MKIGFTLTRCAIGAATLLALAAAAPARAQSPPAADSSRPFEISDNSFLVEEALNQEPGVFQNIVMAGIDSHDTWVATLTQEWPLATRTHQIAFSVPFADVGSRSGLGDAAVHYRLQAMTGERGPAFSPRISLIVPSGSASRGLGQGHVGYEVNLPFSQQVRDLYVHWNAGYTHFPLADRGHVLVPRVAASGIWRTRPMLNVMLESLVEWTRDDVSDARHARVTVSPGMRTGWNVGETQTILGVGVPVVFADGAHNAGVILYASYELPFKR